jgi:hypothetical protein
VVSLVVAVATFASPDLSPLALVVGVPLLAAIGPFQAQVALNADLDEDARRRWRIALYLVPWSMTLYWYRYVRR